jgi:hypothetical protein
MATEEVGNYLRVHRLRYGLSQRDVGILVGYGYGVAVGRHERSSAAPSLLVALAYEVLYDVPVAQLFPGFRSVVAQSVGRNLQELREDFKSKRSDSRKSNFEKKQWLAKQQIG